MTAMTFRTGDSVMFRGKFAERATIRGRIEVVDQPEFGPDRFGVRLENGNFCWAAADQLEPQK
jgi:hypothetical protein